MGFGLERGKEKGGEWGRKGRKGRGLYSESQTVRLGGTGELVMVMVARVPKFGKVQRVIGKDRSSGS